MVLKKCIFFLTLTLVCEGRQLTKLYSIIWESWRQFTEELTNLRLDSIMNIFAEDMFSYSMNTISNLAISIVRSLNIGKDYTLPILISDRNTDDLTKISEEFQAGSRNEDIKLPIKELLIKYKQPVEDHEVETEDGYILTLYRIPSNGSVVFLMHGLLGSADDFVTGGPVNGLAYLLAREGYDVWMGNHRGNKHSRRHVTLPTSDAAFWDFSYHEIGFYDIPAMIDYVLHATGRESVRYIGHSQGTTSFFVMASQRPEYNEKISLMVALSPVAFMTHARSPFVRLLSPSGDVLHKVSKVLGIYELLPDNLITKILMHLMCGFGPLAEYLCGNVIFIVAGFSEVHLDAQRLPVMLGHIPSGASVKQLAHYGQGVMSTDFRQFDYGVKANIQRYNKTVPPRYPLENIVTPVALFYSDADWLAHPADVGVLYKKLRNAKAYKVLVDEFHHMDFIWAKDFIPQIYVKIRELFTLQTLQIRDYVIRW